MDPAKVLSSVRELMTRFADQTGLSSERPPRRYLWTDAFAVCNFLELFRRTEKERWRDLALQLVGQVHTVLGRHREDDTRTGWISGLEELEGRRHPTAGGLRIGKELNERQEDEPFDEGLEWERDGQYFHYLTKWMHALDRVGSAVGDPLYTVWAVELARTAHAGFVYVPKAGSLKRLYWKMSIDLTRPLVPSMGQHDPLDGLITFSQLQGSLSRSIDKGQASALDAEIDDLADICSRQDLVTSDALGIGGLLFDACRMAQLRLRGDFDRPELLEQTLEAAMTGLESFVVRSPLRLPAAYRLAFRELGLAIGLQGVEKIRGLVAESPGTFDKALLARLEAFDRFLPLREQIVGFWREGESREAASWKGHLEINAVMLATSLAPEGFLTI
ncbi:MAG: hypothetical protein P8Z70_03690 [Desulfuromonadales bacterium]